jgi:hypothetical protein
VGLDSANALTITPYSHPIMSDPLALTLLPKITSRAPASGTVGTALTLNGHRLYRAADEKNIFALIAGKAIPASQFTIKSQNQIRITVPSSLTPGIYPVSVRFNAFESRDDITFQVT